MSFYYLERLDGEEQGTLFHLPDGITTIGRATDALIRFAPDERSVSTRQAELSRRGQDFTVTDLESRNGTYLNGERITTARMSPGDELRFGLNGPALRLLVSSTALLDAAPLPPPADRTLEMAGRGRNAPASTATSDGPRPASPSPTKPLPLTKPVRPQSPQPGASLPPPEELPAAGPRTLIFEQQLKQGAIAPADLNALLQNQPRLERILARGEVGDAQAGLLRSGAQASRTSRRISFLLLLLVGLTGAATTAHYAYQSYLYEQQLKKGVSLNEALDRLEAEIAEANAAPDQNRERLKTLLRQLDDTRGELKTVQTVLQPTDVQKLQGDPFEQKIEAILQRFGDTDHHLPRAMVARTRFHVDSFSGPLKGTLGRWLKRRPLYFPIIQAVLEKHHLPRELAYIAMNESGLDPEITSAVGARGLWQLMPGTARQFGLRVDAQVDERIIPEKATEAASRYLTDLIALFGGKRDVMLVMASYNAGEGRLMNALRKIDDPMANRDFWYLYRMGLLPEETNEYVPKVLALMIIAEDPTAYGFPADKLQETPPPSAPASPSSSQKTP